MAKALSSPRYGRAGSSHTNSNRLSGGLRKNHGLAGTVSYCESTITQSILSSSQEMRSKPELHTQSQHTVGTQIFWNDFIPQIWRACTIFRCCRHLRFPFSCSAGSVSGHGARSVTFLIFKTSTYLLHSQLLSSPNTSPYPSWLASMEEQMRRDGGSFCVCLDSLNAPNRSRYYMESVFSKRRSTKSSSKSSQRMPDLSHFQVPRYP